MSYTEIFPSPVPPYPTPPSQTLAGFAPACTCGHPHAVPTNRNIAPPFSESCPVGKNQVNPPSCLLALLCNFQYGCHNISPRLCCACYFSLIFLFCSIRPQPLIDCKLHRGRNHLFYCPCPLPPLLGPPRSHLRNTYRLIAVVIPLFSLSIMKL